MNAQFNSIFFGQFIIITQESYIQFMITGILFFNIPPDLNKYIKENYETQWQNYYAIAVFVLVFSFIVAPIVAVVIIFLPYKTLKRSFCKARFGVLYEDLKIRKSLNKLYPLMFFVRRIIMVLVTIIADYA